MTDRVFMKMHGLGNDFVVFDARQTPLDLDPIEVRAVGDRHVGIGCDQIVVMKPSTKADVFMQLFNQDGSEISACGNASRCVGQLIMHERKTSKCTIETKAGVLGAFDGGGGMITVDMGEVRTGWRDIPLSEERDTLDLKLEVANPNDPNGDPLLWGAVGVNVGNPHIVFLVKNPWAVDLATIGPMLENHPLFPERTNVSLAKITGPDEIQLRVWERGAGETKACGTAACAALVAANRSGAMGRSAVVELAGGALGVLWREDNHILLTGPATFAYAGTYDMHDIVRGLMASMRAEETNERQRAQGGAGHAPKSAVAPLQDDGHDHDHDHDHHGHGHDHGHGHKH